MPLKRSDLSSVLYVFTVSRALSRKCSVGGVRFPTETVPDRLPLPSAQRCSKLDYRFVWKERGALGALSTGGLQTAVLVGFTHVEECFGQDLSPRLCPVPLPTTGPQMIIYVNHLSPTLLKFEDVWKGGCDLCLLWYSLLYAMVCPTMCLCCPSLYYFIYHADSN